MKPVTERLEGLIELLSGPEYKRARSILREAIAAIQPAPIPTPIPPQIQIEKPAIQKPKPVQKPVQKPQADFASSWMSNPVCHD